MLSIFRTTQFKKDYKKLNTQHQNLTKDIISQLVLQKALQPKHKDHKLIGNFKGYREYHIKPDLLLTYKIDNNVLELVLMRIGSHSELFKK